MLSVKIHLFDPSRNKIHRKKQFKIARSSPSIKLTASASPPSLPTLKTLKSLFLFSHFPFSVSIMKFSAPLTILALAAVASASDVLDLTKDAFQKEVAGDGLTLVEL